MHAKYIIIVCFVITFLANWIISAVKDAELKKQKDENQAVEKKNEMVSSKWLRARFALSPMVILRDVTLLGGAYFSILLAMDFVGGGLKYETMYPNDLFPFVLLMLLVLFYHNYLMLKHLEKMYKDGNHMAVTLMKSFTHIVLVCTFSVTVIGMLYAALTIIDYFGFGGQ